MNTEMLRFFSRGGRECFDFLAGKNFYVRILKFKFFPVVKVLVSVSFSTCEIFAGSDFDVKFLKFYPRHLVVVDVKS